MKLDRYSGQAPKFRVLRRQDTPASHDNYAIAEALAGVAPVDNEGGTKTCVLLVTPDIRDKIVASLRINSQHGYAEVEPFDYFVLALKDRFAMWALIAYAKGADDAGEAETATQVRRLIVDAMAYETKIPD